jgi:hypothetical protein
MGFAFEHFDGLGRFRDMDNGHPVDASATVVFNDGTQRDYRGAPDMMSGLAEHAEVMDCFARYWTSFLLGRPVGSVINGAFLNRVIRPECGVTSLPPGCDSGEECHPLPDSETERCAPAVTVASQIADLLQCAMNPVGDVNLQRFAAVFAASGVLYNLTFSCGDERCVNEVEYCFNGSASNQGVHCEPYRDGEADCTVRGPFAAGVACTCTGVENGGVLLTCPAE